MSRKNTDKEVIRVLKAVDLLERWEANVSELSHGMRRRVSVAQALLGEPELILLDEPSAGLDPIQTSRLRDIFLNKPEKSTLVISSHILSELEEVCDYIIFMDKGRCTQQGNMSDITGQSSTVRIRFGGEIDLASIQQKCPHIHFSIEEEILVCKESNQSDVSNINAVVLPILLDMELHIYDIQVGYRLAEHYERRKR